jgi:hypothetical protein
MKIDGYRLREAIKQHELRSAAALSEFPDSLHKFPDDQKRTPSEVSLDIEQAELALAKLRTAQARYNLSIRVSFRNEEITLAEAVKSLVAVGKTEKLWKDLATSRGRHHSYMHVQQTRDANQVVAQPTTTPVECMANAKRISIELGRLKQAIATANAREVEIEGLDSTLFESV